MKKIFLIAFSFFISAQLSAQNYIDFTNHYKPFRLFEKPSIELNYGSSGIKLNGTANNLANAGLIELKLGFTTKRKSYYDKDITGFENRYFFVGNASDKNNPKSKGNEEIKNDLWRFGFGNKDAYGLKLGSVEIMPYNSNSFAWSKFTYENGAMTAEADKNYYNDFNDVFRFGSSTEGGINLQITPGFSIQPQFETAIIFPRHLFGKQLMSSVIEMSGYYLIDNFTKKIMRNAPAAGTFVNFILKNAYEFGFYQLRKDKMNWPFNSAAPIRYYTYKLGLAFTF